MNNPPCPDCKFGMRANGEGRQFAWFICLTPRCGSSLARALP